MRGRCAGSDPRFMRRLAARMSPLGRSNCFSFGLSARRHLFDVFKPKQQLVFGQRLGAAAKAMAL